MLPQRSQYLFTGAWYLARVHLHTCLRKFAIAAGEFASRLRPTDMRWSTFYLCGTIARHLLDFKGSFLRSFLYSYNTMDYSCRIAPTPAGSSAGAPGARLVRVVPRLNCRILYSSAL